MWSAIVASCAIPGMFDKADLIIKGENGEQIPYCPPSRDLHFIDGSVAGDLPMKRLSEMFNINTFIVSQVNPHIVPFISESKTEVLEPSNLRSSFINLTKTLCGNELKHLIKQLEVLGLVPSYMKWIMSVVQQSYKGHVTIVPCPTLEDYGNLMTNVIPQTYWPAF